MDPKNMTKADYIEAIRALIEKHNKANDASTDDASEQRAGSESQGEQEEPKVKERKMKKCAESDSVAARKQQFIQQFVDSEGQVSIPTEDKSVLYYKGILKSLECIGTCNHDHRRHKAKFMCHHCYLRQGN